MVKTQSSLLQKTYIQKSKLFLLPLTGVKKDRTFKSTNTYVSSIDLISAEYPIGISASDYILIVTYNKLYKAKDQELYDKINAAKFKGLIGEKPIMSAWEKFESETLMSNPCFLSSHETNDEFIYTFDLTDWKDDWNAFLKGRYSLFSDEAKKQIKEFRWDSLIKEERYKLRCYLYPYEDDCLERFARDLEIPLAEMAEVKELCSKPDLVLENYKANNLKNRRLEAIEDQI